MPKRPDDSQASSERPLRGGGRWQLRKLCNQFSTCRCPREQFKAFDDEFVAVRQSDNFCHVATTLPAHASSETRITASCERL